MHAIPSNKIFIPHVIHISVNVSPVLAYSDSLYCRLSRLLVTDPTSSESLHEHVHNNHEETKSGKFHMPLFLVFTAKISVSGVVLKQLYQVASC